MNPFEPQRQKKKKEQQQQNVHSDMCAHRRTKSTYVSAQADQSLRCPHEEFKLRLVKVLIRLRECAG